MHEKQIQTELDSLLEELFLKKLEDLKENQDKALYDLQQEVEKTNKTAAKISSAQESNNTKIEDLEDRVNNLQEDIIAELSKKAQELSTRIEQLTLQFDQRMTNQQIGLDRLDKGSKQQAEQILRLGEQQHTETKQQAIQLNEVLTTIQEMNEKYSLEQEILHKNTNKQLIILGFNLLFTLIILGLSIYPIFFK